MLDLQPAHFSQILNSLQGKNFNKIRLVITRWITSKDYEKDLVDKFIDLRIALESLYLQDFLNEQSQRNAIQTCPLWGVASRSRL